MTALINTLAAAVDATGQVIATLGRHEDHWQFTDGQQAAVISLVHRLGCHTRSITRAVAHDTSAWEHDLKATSTTPERDQP